MFEFIKQNALVAILLAAFLGLVASTIAFTVIKMRKRSGDGEEEDIFLNAPAVKINGEPKQNKKPSTEKKADFSWLKGD